MDDALKLFLVLAAIGLAGSATYAVITLVHAIAHRLKGGRDQDVTQEELEYLRDRAEQVEGLTERVAELETRLDFAERLLTRPEHEQHDTPAGSV